MRFAAVFILPLALLLADSCAPTVCTQTSCPIGTVCSASGQCTQPPAPLPGFGEGEGEGEGEGGVGEGEPVGSNGVCGGAAISFHADNVYLYGTLLEGAAGLDAICNPTSPNAYDVGFGEYGQDGMVIRENGDILFREHEFDVEPNHLVIFHQDPALLGPDENDDGADPLDCEFDQHPYDNDPVVPTQCSGDISVFVVQDGGANDILYQCVGNLNGTGDADWLDLAGDIIHLPDVFDINAYDAAGKLLAEGAVSDLELVDVATAAVIPVTGYAGDVFNRSTRAAPGGGFFTADSSTVDNVTTFDIWSISDDGIATLKGSTTLDTAFSPRGVPVINGAGDALFLFSTDVSIDVFDDVILKLPLGGPSTVIYREDSNPVVKIHISNLFSGGAVYPL
ncbi:MAG TPA: hypothetical protein VGO62_03150 [Myxococcota bacterium]|jgi:hypothetical protein